jgi:ABC-type multidrug transport system fused ATPase/permease subunit
MGHDLYCSSEWLPNALKWHVNNYVHIMIKILFICYNAPYCILIVPVSATLLTLIFTEYIQSTSQLEKLQSDYHTDNSSHAGEAINGAITIKTFNKEHMFEEKDYICEDVNYSFDIIRRGIDGWLSMRLDAVAMIFVIGGYFYCVIFREGQDSVLLGILLQHIMGLQWQMNGLVHEIKHIHGMIPSFDKCKKFCQIPQEAAMRLPLPQEKDGKKWFNEGTIKFNNYSVKYRPDTEVVLKNLSIEIKQGEKVGVVGRTGAGKSTICLALCRVLEALEGNIEIDGVDISTVGLDDLRERITMIPQEAVLFHNTLRFNLDPEEKHTDKDLKDMIERACLNHLLERDNNGLDFLIEGGGSNLSEGEKSLVCICRAALKKNKVVIMDEATASIDVNTEETIQKLIKDEFQDATVITVAHRLNTVMHGDKILVLSFGEVQEFDSPEVLLKDEESAFSKLVAQFNK